MMEFVDSTKTKLTHDAIVDGLLKDTDMVEALGYTSLYDDDEKAMAKLGIDKDALERMKMGKAKGAPSEVVVTPVALPSTRAKNQNKWYSPDTVENVFAPTVYVHDVRPPQGNIPNGWKAHSGDIPTVSLDAEEAKSKEIRLIFAQIR